jgi:hypothetical protein
MEANATIAIIAPVREDQIYLQANSRMNNFFKRSRMAVQTRRCQHSPVDSRLMKFGSCMHLSNQPTTTDTAHAWSIPNLLGILSWRLHLLAPLGQHLFKFRGMGQCKFCPDCRSLLHDLWQLKQNLLPRWCSVEGDHISQFSFGERFLIDAKAASLMLKPILIWLPRCRRLRRANPKTGKRLSLRSIADALAARGFVNKAGKAFASESIRSMLEP